MKIGKIKKFIEFSLIWYSQQFAIPFWIIGHVHLHLNDYSSIFEFTSSAILHLLVAIGFWIDWKKHGDVAEDENR